ncbi:MAG: ComEC/Rec2 family competence protein, partial [Candidatus Omnitrophota bacterium]|nr:ComEC/Rec2 family competence protein [Candidatus Omnitrophota bacterium]
LANQRAYSREHITFTGRYYQGETVTLTGRIVSEVQRRSSPSGMKTTFTLDVRRIETPQMFSRTTGRVLVTWHGEPDAAYGDDIAVDGRLKRAFDYRGRVRFSYRKYLSRQGIEWTFSAKRSAEGRVLSRGNGHPVRELAIRASGRLKKIIQDHFPPGEAGLLTAFLLGDRLALPDSINQIFFRTGTLHVLAISGSHVVVVAACVFFLLKLLPVPFRAQYLLVILFLVFYAVMTGARPSVVRAVLMTSVFLASFMFERETMSLNTLSLSGLALCLWNPENVFDLGFQLSFLSVFTIIVFYPPAAETLARASVRGRHLPKILTDAVAVSFAAWLGVAGVVAYNFMIVTPVTMPANLLVVPLMGALVVLGMGMLFCGLAAPFLLYAFVPCVSVVINAMIIAADLADRVPGAYFYWKGVSWGHAVCYYGVIGFLACGPRLAGGPAAKAIKGGVPD